MNSTANGAARAREIRDPSGRPPPHDENAERAVLAAVLLEPALADQVLRQSPPDDFHVASHRIVATAIAAIRARGGVVDVTTIASEIRDRGQLQQIGGSAWLVELADSTPSILHVDAHCAIVANKARLRRTIATAQAIAAEGYGDVGAIDDWLTAARHRLDESGRGPHEPCGAIASAWQPLEPRALFATPPARRWLVRHPTRDGNPAPAGHGDGLLPLGKVGALTSEGGVGKTAAILALGVSIITGRRWFGHFDIDAEAQRGRVLVALGEEDRAEVERRLFEVAQVYELDADERRRVCEALVVLPLAGKPVPLLRRCDDGRGLQESDDYRTLVAHLQSHGGEHGWSLVALDPLTRFAGDGTETDNYVATRTIQCFEALTEVAGNPTVLIAHHSNGRSRHEGTVESRGVTGITDALRWEGILRPDGVDVVFRQKKSNYSRRMDAEVRLVRCGTVLRAPTSGEQQARTDATAAREVVALDDDIRKVVAALRREGQLSSVDAIVLAAGIKTVRGRAAVKLALSRGLILRTGTAREPTYTAANQISDRVCEESPHTPRDAGTPDVPSLVERSERPGTLRDAVGRRDVEESKRDGKLASDPQTGKPGRLGAL